MVSDRRKRAFARNQEGGSVERFVLAWIILGVALGAAMGVSAYTFVYANGSSYLTDRPEACANCHIMREYYAGWIKSSHRGSAVCNDCHTPDRLVAKYWSKVSNGYHHSYAFTTGKFPDVLQIQPRNREIVRRACQKCHQQIVQAMEGPHQERSSQSCVRCHASVGHFR